MLYCQDKIATSSSVTFGHPRNDFPDNRKIPPNHLFLKGGESLPLVKGGQEGFYPFNRVSRLPFNCNVFGQQLKNVINLTYCMIPLIGVWYDNF